jgi:predicted enzyme related to lactoylglutathione lyase
MLKARVSGIAIDCPDSTALCAFYGALLDIEPENEGLVIAKDEVGELEIWFQQVEGYVPPTWPTQERGQQIHIDFDCEDREAMVARAIELGARKVDVANTFTVMLDPAGHPFCICDRR